MKDLEELLPRVMEVASACPEPTAIGKLRDAAIEFCRRTRVWRATESWTVGTSKCEIVAVSQEAQLFEITHAKLGDIDLDVKTVDWLDKERPGWRDEEGTSSILTQIMPNTVRLVPKPTEGTVTLEMVLVPSITTERIPNILVDTYSQVIADGAIARVLMLPNEAFANPQLGGLHAAEFNRELDRWSNQIPKGQQKAPRRTRSRFF